MKMIKGFALIFIIAMGTGYIGSLIVGLFGIKPVGSLTQGSVIAVASYWISLIGGIWLGKRVAKKAIA